MAQAQLGFHWGLQLWLGFFDLFVVSRLSPAIPWGPGLSAAVLRAQDPRPDVSALCLVPSIGRTCLLLSIERIFVVALHWADVGSFIY